MKGPRLVVAMWLVAVGLIVAGHIRSGEGTFPPASGFTGAAAVYSFLVGLASIPATSSLAGIFAVGWTINLWRQLPKQAAPTAPAHPTHHPTHTASHYRAAGKAA